MERIRQMKVSLKQKRIRDKLAGASEARGSVNHAEIAKLRVQIEEYEVCDCCLHVIMLMHPKRILHVDSTERCQGQGQDRGSKTPR